MAETFVRDDINNYVARNIFGHFSKRSAVAALAAASVVSVGIYGVYAWDWNLEAVTYLAIPVCVGIGVIGSIRTMASNRKNGCPHAEGPGRARSAHARGADFRGRDAKKDSAELRKEKRREKAAKKARSRTGDRAGGNRPGDG